MTYGFLEELVITAEQQRECVEELSQLISNVSSLEVINQLSILLYMVVSEGDDHECFIFLSKFQVAEKSSKICLIRSIESTSRSVNSNSHLIQNP